MISGNNFWSPPKKLFDNYDIPRRHLVITATTKMNMRESALTERRIQCVSESVWVLWKVLRSRERNRERIEQTAGRERRCFVTHTAIGLVLLNRSLIPKRPLKENRTNLMNPGASTWKEAQRRRNSTFGSTRKSQRSLHAQVCKICTFLS